MILSKGRAMASPGFKESRGAPWATYVGLHQVTTKTAPTLGRICGATPVYNEGHEALQARHIWLHQINEGPKRETFSRSRRPSPGTISLKFLTDCGVAGAPRELHGSLLGTTWGPLVRSWGCIGGHLGMPWAVLAPSGPLLGLPGAVLGRLGRLLGRIEALLGCLGAVFGAS